MKRIASILLLLTMVLSMFPTSVFADITTAGGSNDVPVELTQAVSEFSVTVPTVLPVDVSADGEVTVATDNKIINNSWGPVEIKEVSLVSQNDWELVDFETDFKTKNVGLKEYGFKINDAAVEVDGGCAAEFEVINGNSEIGFTYDANIATQKTALEDVEISQVVFVIGWSRNSMVNESSEPGLYDANGVMLCSWEDSGINLESSGAQYSYSVLPTIRNKYPETTQIVIPSTITHIGNHAFRNCTTLTTVVIPASVTTISERAFEYCSNLENIVLLGEKVSLGRYSFSQCTSLTTFVIPSGITNLSDGVFYGCLNLKTITISKNVTVMNASLLRGCKSLSDIYYEGTEAEWNAISKGSYWNMGMGENVDGGTTIHYNYQG